MVPPRVPQFSWVNLGLPSGTLWLDRLVGAQSPSSPGLYYQWGAVKGHTSSDGYVFNTESYDANGLNQISSDLTINQDAAQLYYGNIARMPSLSQFDELIAYCELSRGESGVIRLTSTINGNSIVLMPGGAMTGDHVVYPGELRVWSIKHVSERTSTAIHSTGSGLIHYNDLRYLGLNVMAVHS